MRVMPTHAHRCSPDIDHVVNKLRRPLISGYQSLGAGCSLRERELPCIRSPRDVSDASDDAFRPAASARSYALGVTYPSVRYAVATAKANGVDVSIAYHPAHTANVKAMLASEKADALAAMSAAQLSAERARASDYYLGDMEHDMPAVEGRSPGGAASAACEPARAAYRANDTVVRFGRGGDAYGYPGKNELTQVELTTRERSDLVAFLRALDGPGPAPSLLAPP